MLSATETITLSCGEIQVFENTFPMSQERTRLENKIPELKSDSDPFLYFSKAIYPELASVSRGKVPSPEVAFAMPRDEWDLWYLVVWKLNPEWFFLPWDRPTESRIVEFRDGSKLTIAEANNMPSRIMQLFELERDSILNPADDPDYQVFRSVFYPKMAACVTSDPVPSAGEVFKWPTSEINKWYLAARDLNPVWFRALDQESDKAVEAAAVEAKETKKKGARKRDG